jgi:glucose-1-phosphate thymidylyltransferase
LKGVILHGGQGTRLRPLTYAGPKQLIPIANKPVSQYVLEDLISLGIKDIAIILGETFPELVREYYGDGSRFGVKITYINQGKALGIAHAVSLCKEFVGEDDFVVYLGDNIFQYGIAKYASLFTNERLDSMILLKEVDEPQRFGVAKLDGNGKLVKLVEKPKEHISNYAVVGVYFFSPSFFKIVGKLKPSRRNELEITDAIQLMIDDGYKVGYSFVDGWWADTGKKNDILALNATILDERIESKIDGKALNSRIEGRVSIAEGTIVENSTVRGPAIIGRNTRVIDSHIGPYTSIGDSCNIKKSSIEYSIIMDNTSIEEILNLEDSLVGRNAKIKSNNSTARKTLKLHISDYSEVEV